MNQVKTNTPLVIWRNEDAIIRETAAYKRFIEILKAKLEMTRPLIGKTVDSITFWDLLSGCTETKKAIEKDLNDRLLKQSDDDLKDYIRETSNKKLIKLDEIAKSIKESLNIKVSWIESYYVDVDLIIFGPEGQLSFDESKIVDKHSVKIDNELRNEFYSTAQTLIQQIQAFNERIKELTENRYYGLQSYRFTDRQALILNDDDSIDINPDFVKELTDSSPIKDTTKVNK